ncbi:MAG: polyprenyl synthetase family protein [bacterium]|nr:polyprenyl synthetase family protein [bacterium]
MFDTVHFDLKGYLNKEAQIVNQALENYLPKQGQYAKNLGEVMRYSVFPGGKRFRPILTLSTAAALNADPALALPAACAFELVHCFSLVHDDLPCMDNDDFRRGKPTVHKAYGEDTALLAGDALIIEAFNVAAQTNVPNHPEITGAIVRETALAAGHLGMVGGQILDMDAQHHGATKESLLEVHKGKTGALIRGAARAGAIVAGASPKQLEEITEYSEILGLVFQITDDILDAQSDPDPISFPTLFGMEESKRIAQEKTNRALQILEPWGEKALPLAALANYLLVRTV